MKEAKLRHSRACLEDFGEPGKRGLERTLLRELQTCRWIDENQNILLTGPTGVGKTYLACALGQLGCRRGYRVLYRRTPRFIDELTMARADGSLSKLYTRLAKFNVLILASDDPVARAWTRDPTTAGGGSDRAWGLWYV